jgi:hypothetical protein
MSGNGEMMKDDGPPKSWEDVGAPDVNGWFQVAEGASFTGKCVGRIQMENDDGMMRDVVLVKLDKPCTSAVFDGEAITVAAGEILGVGIRAKLSGLLEYVEKQGRVYVKALTKQKLKGGRTMWTFEAKGEPGKKAPPPAPSNRAAATDTASTADLGF